MNTTPFMDKQIMDLSQGSAATHGKDFMDLMNHPEEEKEGADPHIHHTHQIGGALHNGIDQKEEIVPSYDFQPIRPLGAATSPSPNFDATPILSGRAWSSASDSKLNTTTSADPPNPIRNYGSLDSTEPANVVIEKDQSIFDSAIVSEIDQTMKKHADNLLHVLEGVSARLTQLESRTRNLENSVDDLKVSVGNNHGSTDGRMRQLENILREVQSGVQVLKDKQLILDAQLELAKLKVSKVDQQPETQNTVQVDSLQQAASAPQQSQQYLSPVNNPQALPALPPPNAPPQPSPHPNLSPPVQLPPQLLQNQIPSIPQRDPYFQPPGQTPEAPNQQYQSTLSQQSHPPPVAPPHQQFQPASQQQFSQPPPQLPQQHPSLVPANPTQLQPSLSHHAEELPYASQNYPPNFRQPPSQTPSGPPPPQQFYGAPSHMYEPPSSRSSSGFSSGYGPPSGPTEPYHYGVSPQYVSTPAVKPTLTSPAVTQSGGSGYPQLPTARVLPQALPTASGVSSGSGSPGTGNRVPIDDVIDKVSTMGFPRDHVRATVQKLTENGQSVDLNIVLDKLMNEGNVQPPREVPMELKVSSPKLASLSPSDCVGDPEEKEVSDDDDDDRNHKHRRRETRSQSLERDALEHVMTRPYRKYNKHFEYGHPFRENESPQNQKDLSSKFERRRPGLMARTSLDSNHRFRGNQMFSGAGPGRGRGRDSGSWNQRDSRFSSVDIASQLVHQGPIPPSLYNGMGLANVSNAQSASWNAFGLITGLPTGSLETLHSIGLQGTLRPPINPSMNIGIPHQRCRDFEERGFCLRGDMCPMEHGVNRIVIEDVQGLSQFNLPVSLPSVHLLGTPAGTGPLPSVSASSTTLTNSKGFHSKSSKPGLVEDGLGFNGAFSGSGCVGGADLYDPDQPLWNNNCTETSNGQHTLQSPNNKETDSVLNDDPSDRHNGRSCDSADNECLHKSPGIAVASQGTGLSVWGRIGSSNNRLDVKAKIDSMMSSSDYFENEANEDKGALASVQNTSHQGKHIIAEVMDSKAMALSPKTPSDGTRNMRKPSQKALRTLFVNGIPQKNNKRVALLSHFQKFGEIVDIYIPANSERAFVQFSTREAAEAALQAPDAVMGNRFIKLWWANRDSIPDYGLSSGSSVSVTPRGATAASVPSYPSLASKGKDINQSAASKSSVLHGSDASISVSDHPKPVISDGPKVPPLQKKLVSLEQLKEELRKKQELLDWKRNDFRRQLQKLEKQATGLKGEVDSEQAAKRPKVEIVADIAKAATPRSTADPGSVLASPRAEIVGDQNKSVDNVVSNSPKTSSIAVLQEPMSLKQPIRPVGPVGTPFLTNRYKLDNRPTAFRILPPLPAGLASDAVLKEHFSSYGDISNLELEDQQAGESEASKNCSARITFTTRRSAERAFGDGKCWQGHTLEFMWLTSSDSAGGRENSPSIHKGHSDGQTPEKIEGITPEEGSASENGEPENSVRESGVERGELGDDDSQPSASTKSSERASHEGHVR